MLKLCTNNLQTCLYTLSVVTNIDLMSVFVKKNIAYMSVIFVPLFSSSGGQNSQNSKLHVDELRFLNVIITPFYSILFNSSRVRRAYFTQPPPAFWFYLATGFLCSPGTHPQTGARGGCCF